MRVRFRKGDFRRLTRNLRVRLTAAYAFFFALLLFGIAIGFREYLESVLDQQAKDDLIEEWAGIKGGFLRFENDPELGWCTDWYYDATDPDETTAVFDIKKTYLVTDQTGKVLVDTKTKERQVSTEYEDIGIDKPAEIQARVRKAEQDYKPGVPGVPLWTVRHDSSGARYLIRSVVTFYRKEDDIGRGVPFFVALGKSREEDDKVLGRYTWRVLILLVPGGLILGSFLGWIMAGRVLTPVREVAHAAQRISGSNLSLRIPTRQADDELDYLILTFNRMIDRLEASFQQMKQFSADVSHELRTPITAIRGQLEVALFTAKTTDQYREAMFNALQDIDRLSQIVRALLLLSQAESGQLVLQKSRLNLCEVVRDLVEQFQIPAEAAGVRLTADLPPECAAEGDRVQIERMITNLLSNAIKFTPEGGRVRVSLQSAADHIEIAIEDTGRGIPGEFLPHIFDRFYRVPGSGTAPGPEQGLGLGLSFVAWIVKAHHGKIDVDSTPGKGTRFTIKLPADGVGSDTLEMEQPVGLA
ncbi:Heavy metal sensor signal transduction histidine kinase [Candidatus Sulfopaludibacter sp. SbA3]|nr:Heavy metal sensor signal transduction histidine kinase [Candidatus Sulfopaludibacter sp. SbA3]